jgi:hypothetical protein
MLRSMGGTVKEMLAERYDRARPHPHICRIFIYVARTFLNFLYGKNQMKKLKRSGRDVNAKRGAKRNNRNAKRNGLAETIREMAAQGLVEDQIACRVGLDKNDLRARFIDDIKRGKSAAAASEVEAEALTMEDYHYLDVVTDSFNSHWFDETDGRNLLFRGVDGKGARTIADAFAAWKQRGGRYNCTGRSTRFNKEKAIEFAKVVAEYRNNIRQRKIRWL